MNYLYRDFNTKYDYRKGSWTCKASSLGIELSNNDYHPYSETIQLMESIVTRTRLYPCTILYKINRYGFNRIEKYKGLKSEESVFSLYDCHRFSTEDDGGCSYMYSCAQIDLSVTNPCIFDFYQAVVFLATKSKYQDVLNMIPKLKSIENIENYLIQSGIIIVESEDTFDIGYYLWFISNKDKIQHFADKINKN